ncbi:MAG: hypothetical protein CMJ46_11025 [Planctomyces sp.]|nr:hypothetical protein [Planctomyces sp.]
MKQISICDVTLWGIARSQKNELPSDSLREIVAAIDGLNVDEILIPDSLLSDRDTANSICSAISSAEIIIAVTELETLHERIAHSGRTEYSCRMTKAGNNPVESELDKLKKSGCQRVEWEVDTHSGYSQRLIDDYQGRGIDRLILSDHSGRVLPHQVGPLLKPMMEWNKGPMELGCRFRHDMGVSVANALTAIECGITHLDCSLLGVGPYAGYTPLEELATTLRIHSKQYGGDTRIKTEKLIEANQLVSRLLNLPICPNKPVSGENIFATEAGIHQDGLLKNPDTYLPYRPELVGAAGIQLVIGRHSGKRAVAHRLEELGHTANDAQVMEVLQLIKTLPKGEKVTNDKLTELFSRTI